MSGLVSAADRPQNGKRSRARRLVVDHRDDRDPGQKRPFFEGAAPSLSGMGFSDALPFDRWVEIGRNVRTHQNASLWWLGDWLNHGKKMYGRRYKYGVALSGLDYHTLRNYAMVARRLDLSRRRDNLSFHHHAEVCALSPEQQDLWLDRAEEGAWTRNELRRQLREERRPTTHTNLRISIDLARRSRWLGAASTSGVSLETWILHTLDAAAEASLGGDSPTGGAREGTNASRRRGA